MPHRLSTHGYAELGEVEHVRPRLASEGGVRVSGVSVDDEGALWFRAEGAVAGGVYRERERSAAELAVPDEGGVLLEPLVRRGVVVMKRCPPAGAPSYARDIVFQREGGSLAVPGQSVALSGDGRVALVVDVPSRTFTVVDVEALTARPIPSIALEGLLTAADPQQAPLLSLDERGEEALFHDVDRPHGEASLYGLSLESAEVTRVYGPVSAPSWVSGGFVPGGGGVLVVACGYGDVPSTRVLFLGRDGEGKELFHAPVSAPAGVPAFLDEKTAVMPLSLTTHPSTTYGPVHLVALSLEGKAPVIVTKSGELRGSARVLPSGVVVVEGGDALITIQPEARA